MLKYKGAKLHEKNQFHREGELIVKKTRNKKKFIIFFQQGIESEKKCIFASLLKYSVRRGVTKQS